MLKVGLVGFGAMGTGHFNVYRTMKKNGLDVSLVAICDVDMEKLEKGKGTAANIDVGDLETNLNEYNLYADMEEMIQKENLDYVDICLPTYLHSPYAVKAMEMGVHVFCEKPMAISVEACQKMIDASKKTGKHLMIGHCLRYWDAYEYAKELINNKKYGEVISAYFFRGGATPFWSWENWLLNREKSGGALLDQHIHDVDTVNWLFGVPSSLSSSGRVVFENSGYDSVSTNYHYPDRKVVTAQDDWSINGKGFGFRMTFRINFEKGALLFEDGIVKDCPNEGEMFHPELHKEDAYYKEIRLFTEKLAGKRELDLFALLESHKTTIWIAEAEVESCDKFSELVKLS